MIHHRYVKNSWCFLSQKMPTHTPCWSKCVLHSNSFPAKINKKRENHHFDKEIHPGKFTWNLQNHPIEFRKIIWSIHPAFMRLKKNGYCKISSGKHPQQTSKKHPPPFDQWPATTSIALAHRTSIRCCWRHGTCDPFLRFTNKNTRDSFEREIKDRKIEENCGVK